MILLTEPRNGCITKKKDKREVTTQQDGCRAAAQTTLGTSPQWQAPGCNACSSQATACNRKIHAQPQTLKPHMPLTELVSTLMPSSDTKSFKIQNKVNSISKNQNLTLEKALQTFPNKTQFRIIITSKNRDFSIHSHKIELKDLKFKPLFGNYREVDRTSSSMNQPYTSKTRNPISKREQISVYRSTSQPREQTIYKGEAGVETQ